MLKSCANEAHWVPLVHLMVATSFTQQPLVFLTLCPFSFFHRKGCPSWERQFVAFCCPRASWLRVKLLIGSMCVHPGFNPAPATCRGQEASSRSFSFPSLLLFYPQANISHLTSSPGRTHPPLPQDSKGLSLGCK